MELTKEIWAFLGLFKVAIFFQFVAINAFRIGPLCPVLRSCKELAEIPLRLPAYGCLANCSSISSQTSSPINTPPASKAAFQFRPHSFRLIFPSILITAFSFPQGSLTIPLNSTYNLTDLANSSLVNVNVQPGCTAWAKKFSSIRFNSTSASSRPFSKVPFKVINCSLT